MLLLKLKMLQLNLNLTSAKFSFAKQSGLVDKAKYLIFQIEYPEIEDLTKPSYRFISSYEQKVQPFDKIYQYLLFAVEPYEIIAFKAPRMKFDKFTLNFFLHYDPNLKMFTLQLYFKSKLSRANKPHPSSIANGAAALGVPPKSMPLPPQAPHTKERKDLKKKTMANNGGVKKK
ncbi:hypothetical protein AHAS_Ahas15G0045400 [Arachis hypogaea]